jgi:hypothetical protein
MKEEAEIQASGGPTTGQAGAQAQQPWGGSQMPPYGHGWAPYPQPQAPMYGQMHGQMHGHAHAGPGMAPPWGMPPSGYPPRAAYAGQAVPGYPYHGQPYPAAHPFAAAPQHAPPGFQADPAAAQQASAAAGLSAAMGEMADKSGLGMVKGFLDFNDSEFWKGALVGAAVVLLVTNDELRSALIGGAARTAEAVKSGMSGMAGTQDDTPEDMRAEPSEQPGQESA